MSERIDKSSWGPGPWDHEPDVLRYVIDGFACFVNRPTLHGALCGYVAIPPGHPWHGKDHDDIHEADPDLEVHGGLTFSNLTSGDYRFVPSCFCPDEAEFQAAIEKSPDDDTTRLVYADWLCEEGRYEDEMLMRQNPELWWIGFDCAHAFDFQPGMAAHTGRSYHGHNLETGSGSGLHSGEVYRDLNYVKGEIAKLAARAKRAAGA